MNKTDRSMFRRALCIALSALLVVTVAGIPESFAAPSGAIGDTEVPMAALDEAAADTSESANVGGGETYPDDGDYLAGVEEAALAEEERSADIDELGYIPGEIIVVYEEAASDAEKQAAILKAEAEKQAAILKADGEAQAIMAVQKAMADSLALLNEKAPNDQVIKLKALEAMQKVADGKATKIIIPSELQGFAGLASGIAETVKETK